MPSSSRTRLPVHLRHTTGQCLWASHTSLELNPAAVGFAAGVLCSQLVRPLDHRSLAAPFSPTDSQLYLFQAAERLRPASPPSPAVCVPLLLPPPAVCGPRCLQTHPKPTAGAGEHQQQHQHQPCQHSHQQCWLVDRVSKKPGCSSSSALKISCRPHTVWCSQPR